MRQSLAIGIALVSFIIGDVASVVRSLNATETNGYFAADDEDAASIGDQGPMDSSPVEDGSNLKCGDLSCCFDVCAIPCFYFQVEALYWDRINTGCNEVVVIDTDDDSTLLTTDDLDSDSTFGTRLLLGWQPKCCSHCCAWELGYWGIFDWNSQATVVGNGDLAIPGDLGLASNNFFLADIIGADYSSNLHNIEMNCIKSCCLCCTRLDFIAGFRYVALNEDFVITATDFQEGTSTYDIDVDNALYGAQLGGRMTQGVGCHWAIELTGKAGLFYNDVSNDQLVTDFPNTPNAFVLRDVSSNDSGVAMMSEIGAVLIGQITPSWNVRLGYSACGLGGVALAPDQLDFTDTLTSGTAINNTGWIFAHGVTAGVERRW